MVFTSTRSGDLELYTCALDGTDVVQVTNELGYDGGAFFSPDGSQLIWRASRPKTDDEVAHYKELLAKGLVEPTAMELFIANADGTDARQLTDLGGANWAPLFPSRRQARPVLKQPQDGGLSLQHFHDQHGWNGTHTNHLRQCVRFIPHVLARWKAHRLFIQSKQRPHTQHQRICRRLG